MDRREFLRTSALGIAPLGLLSQKAKIEVYGRYSEDGVIDITVMSERDGLLFLDSLDNAHWARNGKNVELRPYASAAREYWRRKVKEGLRTIPVQYHGYFDHPNVRAELDEVGIEVIIR